MTFDEAKHHRIKLGIYKDLTVQQVYAMDGGLVALDGALGWLEKQKISSPTREALVIFLHQPKIARELAAELDDETDDSFADQLSNAYDSDL